MAGSAEACSTLSTHGALLMDFVAYCEQHAVATVTTDVALAWATGTARSRDRLWWARRLMVVRIFARHLRALNPATQVPPMDVLPHSHRRTTPYLYSRQQLTDLVQAAGQLRPRLRGLSYAAVIGLLAPVRRGHTERDPNQGTSPCGLPGSSTAAADPTAGTRQTLHLLLRRSPCARPRLT